MNGNEWQEIVNYVMEQLRRRDKPKFAMVEEITANGLRIKFANSPVASQKSYKRLASYESPTVGDRVLVEWVGNPANPDDGTYIIRGKVI